MDLTAQEAYYLAGLVGLDISKDIGAGSPLSDVQEKQKTLGKLRRLAGEEEKRVLADIDRAFKEFQRQAFEQEVE